MSIFQFGTGSIYAENDENYQKHVVGVKDHKEGGRP